MSRPVVQRSLTLTEELERLEQSITLTLQEIDSNFSKAHRIATTSILPIVEQYAKHSNDVWEGSKFWKHFFEASANVSLSGYEEPAEDEFSHTEDDRSLQTPTSQDEDTVTDVGAHEEDEDEFTLESPTQVTGVQTTPKIPTSPGKTYSATSRERDSRSGSSRRSTTPRKYTGANPRAIDLSSEQPSTPRVNPASELESSPFEPESAYQNSAYNSRQNNDPLLHRVLDKTYRIQATPHTQRKQPQARQTPAAVTKRALWEDSPQSSPEMAVPQLRTDLFSPPPKSVRTPGVSVLTPARKSGPPAPTTSTGRQLFSPEDKAYASTRDRTRMSRIFDDDSDDETDDYLCGVSPPKTMQFHVPQSRLMQTPAREASKRIVEDLLLTAGADATDDIEADEYTIDAPSPSIVRGAFDIDDDTF